MKNAAFRLSFFLIAIQITRVSAFLGTGLKLGWMGVAFAIAIGYGVYLSAYFFGKAHGWAKLPALCGLILFGGGDLWFNEMELIRVLSATDLVVETANFMNYTAEDIRWFMHYSALFFGAMPTIGAGLLGWIQTTAEGIEEFKEPGLLARIGTALGTIVVSGAGVAVVRLERLANIAPPNGQNLPLLEGQTKLVKRWKNLTAEEISRIIGPPGMGREQMVAFFGISDGAAGDWKRRLESGERPWPQ